MLEIATRENVSAFIEDFAVMHYSCSQSKGGAHERARGASRAAQTTSQASRTQSDGISRADGHSVSGHQPHRAWASVNLCRASRRTGASPQRLDRLPHGPD